MSSVGFEPTISAGERPQTYALDREATASGTIRHTTKSKEVSPLWLCRRQPSCRYGHPRRTHRNTLGRSAIAQKEIIFEKLTDTHLVKKLCFTEHEGLLKLTQEATNEFPP